MATPTPQSAAVAAASASAMTQTAVKQNVCLICIDGWGIAPTAVAGEQQKGTTAAAAEEERDTHKGDAIWHAETPVMDALEREGPSVPIAAHGNAVGLPEGLMGNSEVGHLNIGAGRVVYQDIVRIDLAVKQKKLGTLPAVAEAFARVKKGNGRLHLLGLISDGGVHAHIQHLFAYLVAAKEAAIPHVFIHFFADGRDTAPTSAVKYLEQLKAFLAKLDYPAVQLASVTGRYYAMDRDNRWERITLAYEALTEGKGEDATLENIIEKVEARYAADEKDEFLKPFVLHQEGVVKDDDTLLWFNYRSDRMRQITKAFGLGDERLTAAVQPKNLGMYTMTQYKADYPFKIVFPAQKMDNVLAEWLSHHNIPQIHIAETEKYAHVTFFFNGGREVQFAGEERDLIASPKVQTYDLAPAMSAKEVGEKVADRVREGKAPFIMCNFAPPDMVGHTGVYDAAVKACGATDEAIGAIAEACKAHNYTLFVTADHGNAEKMMDLSVDPPTPHTAHTCNPVPFTMAVPSAYKGETPTFKEAVLGEKADVPVAGSLCDVAPTILDWMGLDAPPEMDGQSLLVKTAPATSLSAEEKREPATTNAADTK